MTPDETLVPPPVEVLEPAPTPYAPPTGLQQYATRIKVTGVLFAVLALFYLVSLIFFGAAAATASAGLKASMQNAPAGSRAATQTAAQKDGIMALFAVLFTGTKIMGLVLCAIAAVGLLTKQKWGRIATLIVSIPLLILFPLGTILGAYAIYLMVKNGSRENWAMLTS